MNLLKQGTPLNKLGTGVAGLVLVLVIVAAVNITLANLRVRVDLTEQKLFSLSHGTKQILATLPDDVVLKFYFSRSSSDVPIDLKTYARHVEDLLQEYRLAGHGRVILETYDPAPDSDAEEWAQRQGLEPMTISPFAPQVFFGLVAKCGSEEQCIPSLSPQDDPKLEFMITRTIARVAFPKKPVLGVMSSLPVLGPAASPMMMPNARDTGWIAFKELKETYDVRSVAAETDRIDPEISTLIVIHPKNLTTAALYAIDQFVLRGGRLIACVDPVSTMDTANEGNPMMMMGGSAPSTLGKLFDAWGVGFDTTKVVADLRAVTRLQGRGQVVECPTFLSVDPKGLNSDDLVNAQVRQVMLPFAGEFVDRTGGKVVFTPLITSSPGASCPIDAMGAQFATVPSIRSQFKPDGIGHVLAARLKGTFKTAFPHGPDAANTNSAPNQLVSGASTIVLFADTDFLADANCVRSVPVGFGMESYQPLNDNLTLFANAVEQLSGNEDLIGIRSRGSFNRPFTAVDELEYRAMLQWQAQEDQLTKKLEETRTQLQELQQQKSGSQKLLLSRQQQEAIERFRATEVDINRQLKEVRKSLRKDIDTLGVWVKTLNIAAIPLLVIIFGVVRNSLRRKRR